MLEIQAGFECALNGFILTSVLASEISATFLSCAASISVGFSAGLKIFRFLASRSLGRVQKSPFSSLPPIFARGLTENATETFAMQTSTFFDASNKCARPVLTATFG